MSDTVSREQQIGTVFVLDSSEWISVPREHAYAPLPILFLYQPIFAPPPLWSSCEGSEGTEDGVLMVLLMFVMSMTLAGVSVLPICM